MPRADAQLASFCSGMPQLRWAAPRRHGQHGPDCTRLLGVDEWEAVSAFLGLRDRRAFAAASAHGRWLDRSAWAAQRTLVLPLEGDASFHDLWYAALLPVAELRTPQGERLEETVRSPRDRRLCVCAAARLLTRAPRVHLHGIDVVRRATSSRPALFAGVRDELALIASVSAATWHPAVRSTPAGRPRRDTFFVPLERLVGIFGSLETARLAVEALPWPWLRREIVEAFPWCDEGG